MKNLHRALAALLGVMGTAWTATAADVQQPDRPVRVATKVSAFYADDILGSNYASEEVLLEHPSNPKSMRVRMQYRALVQAAAPSGEIPIRHHFENGNSGLEKVVDAVRSADVVPPPPGFESSARADVDDDITPIPPENPAPVRKVESTAQAQSSPNYTNSTPAEISQPVTIEQAVTIRNEGDSVQEEISRMGPGCS